MHAPRNDISKSGATAAGEKTPPVSDPDFLDDVLRMLPNGVTVQDEHGRILLANDAAAAQIPIDTDGAPPQEERLQAMQEALRTGRKVVAEETVVHDGSRRVLLTSHQPARIGGRNLLLSSSADITGQKAFEDQLFHSAYYDELTDLPNRRVIEHRINKLLRAENTAGFALAFLDVDNFKHINDYYGHAVGDSLLVEISRRIGINLRDSDMLSRISGDEVVLLLYPV